MQIDTLQRVIQKGATMTPRQILAQKHGVKETDLKAVIYYSDRSWSDVVVFGAKAIAEHIRKGSPQAKVSRNTWRELQEVLPDTQTYSYPASDFGMGEGIVLLISGRP